MLARLEDNFEQAEAFERPISVAVINLPEDIERDAFEVFKKVSCIKLQEQMRGMDIIGEGSKERELWLCFIGDKENAEKLVNNATEEIYLLEKWDKWMRIWCLNG